MQRNPQNSLKAKFPFMHGSQQASGKEHSNPFKGAGLGVCVCPNCGQETPHKQGFRCSALRCPKCGHTMTGK
ncbi:MAG: hypothetical protein NT145_01295 [Elusimicrobia bacterium]|nr:hypothetical protein [Elusimicrobiota bacterium]